MDEFNTIKKYFLQLTSDCKESLDLKDDAAIVNLGSGLEADSEMVISKDLLVENTHFFPFELPQNIANKAIKANISDIAAMGAVPKYYLLGLGLPKNIGENWLHSFSSQLKKINQQLKINLIGGDTIRSNNVTISITIFGLSKNKLSLKRNAAKNGDLIYVSGEIGDAYLAYQILKGDLRLSKGEEKYFLNKRNSINAKFSLSSKLAQNKIANACCDISDGLLADLSNICSASNAAAKINLNKIPTSSLAKKIMEEGKNNISMIDLITGGEDYELIFTIAKNKTRLIKKLGLEKELFHIGEITLKNKNNIELIDKNGDVVKYDKTKLGFKHF